ncbi:MAG: sulfatase-like hydrolase/transferase [Planctomycetota bacterium]
MKNIRRLPVACFLLCVHALTTTAVAQTDNEQPDIVFILLDDLRWDGVSYEDHPYVRTPNIDALRARGANMRNAFVTTSICCPSRATFLTGMYASHHGVIDNETSEYNPEVTPPVTRYLQQAGYKTAMIGKWHMGQNGQPREYFDHWISFKGQGKYFDQMFNINGRQVQREGYTTDILADMAIDFIDSQSADQPYFLMLSHKAVHEPFQPAPRHADAFGAETMPLQPPSWSSDMRNKPEWQRRQLIRDVRWDWRTRDAENETVPAIIEPTEWEEDGRSVEQYRCVAAVDDGIGRIMEVLEARGTLDNTLIIFSSDNGYFHWEHRRWDKRLAYEDSLRIPMVVAYPGHIEPNSTVEQMVGNIDFAPTVLDFAGVEIPDEFQGLSMKPLFDGSDVQWRDSFFYEYWVDLVHEIPTMIALRTDRYKLIQYPELDDIDELYDLASDPEEMNNLAEDPVHAELHAELAQRLELAAAKHGWQPRVFPRNLDRIRGPLGMLIDLQVENGEVINATERPFDHQSLSVEGEDILFDGEGSRIQFAFNQEIDPGSWPYEIDVVCRPDSDGVIVMQSGRRNGFKLFVQDGRPGIALLNKTWIALNTTIDATDDVTGRWVRLSARIDYNRVDFYVDGELIESRSLPQPFKVRTNAPLIIGNVGENVVSEKVPHHAFTGAIRELTIRRPDVVDNPDDDDSGN